MKRKWFDPERDLTVIIAGSGFDNNEHIVVHCDIVDENGNIGYKYTVSLNEFMQKFQEVEQ